MIAFISGFSAKIRRCAFISGKGCPLPELILLCKFIFSNPLWESCPFETAAGVVHISLGDTLTEMPPLSAGTKFLAYKDLPISMIAVLASKSDIYTVLV
jgi:hypothetical protein